MCHRSAGLPCQSRPCDGCSGQGIRARALDLGQRPWQRLPIAFPKGLRETSLQATHAEPGPRIIHGIASRVLLLVLENSWVEAGDVTKSAHRVPMLRRARASASADATLGCVSRCAVLPARPLVLQANADRHRVLTVTQMPPGKVLESTRVGVGGLAGAAAAEFRDPLHACHLEPKPSDARYQSGQL